MTNTAKNISKAYFNKKQGVASFRSSRCYGVLNSEGQALSADGTTPATYSTMKMAKEIASYCNGFDGYSWVNIFSTSKLAATA